MAIPLVAQTILRQLGGNRFLAMTGASQLVGSESMLMFSLPRGLATNKANKVRVTLNTLGLYEVEFFMLRKADCRLLEQVNGVYADDLQVVFTRHTGLRTHL